MDWIIACAIAEDEGARAALKGLSLPALSSLLATAGPPDVQRLPEASLESAHEWALAQVQGAPSVPTELIETVGPPTAWVTPCHLRLGTHQALLDDPDQLALSEADSRRLHAGAAAWFAQDGMDLRFESASRWLLAGEALRDLHGATPDRAAGLPATDWLPQGPNGTYLRRLQNEVQMLFHAHEVNEARSHAGLVPVNSIWLHETRPEWPAPSAGNAPAALLDRSLRASAMRGDWAAWAQAWRKLDAQAASRREQLLREGGRLVFCGRLVAVSHHIGTAPAWRSWLTRLRPAARPEQWLLAD